ncbi:DUF3347 domain-containing protein [Ferruginibacter albus]|uniref:DUF3347 domain-containing protein n=1 Tax=Ferruginibacter albus TaxID=2875540 RepID=UPI001CC4D4F4|nr:DUF3347 domain-containing protein [Ferruginibacter albus]UAY53564.1 DUF3347 domain-containing protein [Ferruginibacter albus]
MKKVFLLIILLIIGMGIYFLIKKDKPAAVNTVPDDKPIATGSHSNAFNDSVNSLLSNYFLLANAFVNADSANAMLLTQKFLSSITTIPLAEIKKDSSIKDKEAVYMTDSSALADMKAAADGVSSEKTLEAMRHDFATISDNLYSFLKAVNYHGKNLYWYNCSMPFGENTSANWIGNSNEPFNPYLGTKHPDYKSAMLHCGELQDSFIVK